MLYTREAVMGMCDLLLAQFSVPFWDMQGTLALHLHTLSSSSLPIHSPHCITPPLHHTLTASLPQCIVSSLHHIPTASLSSLHHSSLHHIPTASLPHCITPS